MNRQIIACLFTILFFLACEVGEDFIPDNPIDPSNPDYIAPQISITTSPNEGETVSSAQFTFSWDGNRDGMLYRYALDQRWSGWKENQKIVTIQHMDEGAHAFNVQSSYSSGDSSSVASVSFIVDAVKGPSLLFFPRFSQAGVGQTLQLSLLAEEVTNLSGAEIVLSFDASIIEIVNITKGELFNELGQIIFIEDHSSSNTVTISTAVWGENKPTANGTKSLAEIQVKVKQTGSTVIEIQNSSSLRDPNNQEITINQSIGGIIESN